MGIIIGGQERRSDCAVMGIITFPPSLWRDASCALCVGQGGLGLQTFSCFVSLVNGSGVSSFVIRSASMSLGRTCLMLIAFCLFGVRDSGGGGL